VARLAGANKCLAEATVIWRWPQSRARQAQYAKSAPSGRNRQPADCWRTMRKLATVHARPSYPLDQTPFLQLTLRGLSTNPFGSIVIPFHTRRRTCSPPFVSSEQPVIPCERPLNSVEKCTKTAPGPAPANQSGLLVKVDEGQAVLLAVSLVVWPGEAQK